MSGTSVPLTASPAPGSTFAGRPEARSRAGTCSVGMSEARSAAAITVRNGLHSIGCSATFTGSAGTLSPGQSVCVRHTASASPGTTVTTTLTLGSVAGYFEGTTAGQP